MDLSKYAAGTKKYMSKDLWDPNQGEDLTIASIEEVQFQERDGTTRRKLVVNWVEDRPPLTLNKTNMNWILGTYGAVEADWQGKRVHAFHDPTVKYSGRAVGGVVLDRPKTPTPTLKASPGPDKALARALKARALRAPAQPNPEDPNDDIPF